MTAPSRTPLLIVLSGPSGVGKDAALVKLKELDRPWHFVVTATTRPQRPTEQDGRDYMFLDVDTFLGMKEKGEFLECAQVHGRWYGVPRSQVLQALGSGKDAFLKINVEGADTVRRLAPEAVLIFMVPGDESELRSRLSLRMTESSPEMELRLKVAQEELGRIGQFDYRVVNANDGLDRAVMDIDAIITAEKCRVIPRKIPL